MSEKKEVAKTSVKYKAVFDMSDFYKFLHDLLKSMGYDVEEKKYKHKDTQKGKEIEVEWECQRKPDDYTKYKIGIKIKVIGLVDVQIQKGDKKLKANQGDLEVELKSEIITDYADKWEKHPILKFLKGFYDRYFYKDTFGELKDKLWDDTFSIENEVKAFFELPRFM